MSEQPCQFVKGQLAVHTSSFFILAHNCFFISPFIILYS